MNSLTINDDDNLQSTSMYDSYELSKNLEKLSIEQQNKTTGKIQVHTEKDNWNLPSTTSVKEMSNCAASCSHDLPRSKRFRPHSIRRVNELPSLRKSLDSLSISSIKKKTQTAVSKPLSRPRATSYGSLQLSQGKFGAICRKVIHQHHRRRRSFSISSKSSSTEDNAVGINDVVIEVTEPTSNVQQKGCGQEATSPDVPDFPIIENGEVDELAEYFEHFVNVHRKMSALAESMYV